MLSSVYKWLAEKVIARILQPSSVIGYLTAMFAYLSWNPSAIGLEAMKQLALALASVILWLVNERPWIKK